MNNTFSIITGMGIGIGIGILLEKQFNFNFDLNSLRNSDGLRKSERNSEPKKEIYSKSPDYQDQSKSGKDKGLTKESDTGNTD